MKKRVLSGMQPTGRLHLGHYLGVLKNYVKLQEEFESFFMIANWHSMTVFYNNYAAAHRFIPHLVSDWLAAGLDPEKGIIFVQSDVPEIAELHLLLSMVTPVSWVERNPTYKEKQENVEKDIDSYGFLGYPVLQAADILLYKGEVVPIGEDQLPHLELSREIARRFNHMYNCADGRGLVVPQAKLSEYPKVLGTDGRKMSKSYNNTIMLSEPAEDITKKIRGMKTDTNRVRRDDPGDPEQCPVFSYYDYFVPEKKEEIAGECRKAGIGCSDCKKIIGEKILAETEPFREKSAYFQQHPEKLNDILQNGKERARYEAGRSLAEIKDIIGMDSRYLLKA